VNSGVPYRIPGIRATTFRIRRQTGGVGRFGRAVARSAPYSVAMEQRFPYGYRGSETGSAHRLVPAMLLIGLGAFFLLNNLNIVRFREILQYWPVVLIAAGVVKLVDSEYSSGRVGGAILLSVGGLLLSRNLGIIQFSVRDLWPVILIAAGLLMLVNRVWENPPRERHHWRGSTETSVNRLNEQTVFGGVKRSVKSQAFEGGEVAAVFGGVELDLTQADFAVPSVTIEVDAVFGGVEIRIPRHWVADVQGSGIFGAFSDETSKPDPERHPVPKLLIVKGSAVFGGVEIKN
jgi:predicted membrane protein